MVMIYFYLDLWHNALAEPSLQSMEPCQVGNQAALTWQVQVKLFGFYSLSLFTLEVNMSIYKLREILLVCEDIQSSSLNDEEKYDLIFSKNVSQQVFTLCREMGSPLDYYDPDTTYEEDVRAFVNALSDYIDNYHRDNEDEQFQEQDNTDESSEFAYYSNLVQRLQ